MTVPATNGTPYRIISEAMREAGLLGLGRDPNSTHLAVYGNRLTDLFNTLQTGGLKLWLNYDFALTLIAGQGLYTLGPSGNVVMTKPLRVLEGYYIDTNQNRRPLIPLSRNDWDTLATVTTQGVVNSYFVDKQQLSLNVYLWLIPDSTAASGQVHIILQQQVGGVVSITDTMNFPVEWYLTLVWQLAAQICTGQPTKIIDRCTKMAEHYLEKLEAWDVEDPSTSFAPDTRTMNYQGKFR